MVYLPAAEEQLADLWLKTADKEAVTQSANVIERLLANNPLGSGESSVASLRIVFEAPLAVVYDLLEADSLVKVWAVWAWKS